MTDTLPEDWVLIEAAKRCRWLDGILELQTYYDNDGPFRALCDMIAKHEQPPVDRKLLCAREAMAGCLVPMSDESAESAIVRAIELWEDGFGK